MASCLRSTTPPAAAPTGGARRAMRHHRAGNRHRLDRRFRLDRGDAPPVAREVSDDGGDGSEGASPIASV